MSNVSDVRDTVPTITLQGKTYTLRYDFNAWAEMEEHYGSMDAAMEALQGAQNLTGKPVTAIRYFLWIGLHQDIPELTLEAVGRMINLDTLGELSQAIMGAVNQSTGISTEGE